MKSSSDPVGVAFSTFIVGLIVLGISVVARDHYFFLQRKDLETLGYKAQMFRTAREAQALIDSNNSRHEEELAHYEKSMKEHAIIDEYNEVFRDFLRKNWDYAPGVYPVTHKGLALEVTLDLPTPSNEPGVKETRSWNTRVKRTPEQLATTE